MTWTSFYTTTKERYMYSLEVDVSVRTVWPLDRVAIGAPAVISTTSSDPHAACCNTGDSMVDFLACTRTIANRYACIRSSAYISFGTTHPAASAKRFFHLHSMPSIWTCAIAQLLHATQDRVAPRPTFCAVLKPESRPGRANPHSRYTISIHATFSISSG